MKVDDTPKNRQIQQVAATMALENMYMSEDFLKKLISVGEGKMTHEELRQEVIRKHSKQEK